MINIIYIYKVIVKESNIKRQSHQSNSSKTAIHVSLLLIGGCYIMLTDEYVNFLKFEDPSKLSNHHANVSGA